MAILAICESGLFGYNRKGRTNLRRGCYHHAMLLTDTLISRLGRDQGVSGVADHVYCGNCGSREVETRPNWPIVSVAAQHFPNELARPPC